MSRSNNTDVKNPAVKTFKWSEKCFIHYEKGENEEKGKNIENILPFKFLVLDELICIRGFNDNEKSGYWSNEIRDTREEELNVKIKGQNGKIKTCATGLYKNIITDRDCIGAKFCQSVYIAYFEGTELTIGKIELTGAALGAWFEFKKANNIYKGAVSVKEFKTDKKGKVEFTMPIFVLTEVSEATDQKAIGLDAELQEYFKAYFHNGLNVNKEIRQTEPEEQPLPEGNQVIYNDKPNSREQFVFDNEEIPENYLGGGSAPF